MVTTSTTKVVYEPTWFVIGIITALSPHMGTSHMKNKSKKNENQTDTEAIKKKKLTSRQRKALLKIIEKKQKSQKRSEMLNELKSLELSAPSLSLMTSISQTQTSGLRNALKQKKKDRTTKPSEENRSSDEMTVDEDVGSEIDEDEIV
ncbi:uncharacterized protein LOC114123743 isoform X1 [Aphis gossypii]|uniref:uncharacterized protein LOC114123743 isoform X1 n=2 Tax=Aphis gossypii TaxID=80765 RepID=UPI002158EF5A|nr:uncharacterized protein LOC114123743 isoform X1 [Aphis gossypii]